MDNRFAYAILTEFEKHLPYQLAGAGYRWNQEDIVRPFGYPTYQWIQVSRGEGIADLGHGPVRIGPGHALLLYPDDGHSYRGIGDEFVTCWMCFGGSHIEYLLQTLGMPASGIYEVTDGHLLESRIEEAVTLLESGHSLAGLEASALVYTTLMDIYKYLSQGVESYRAVHDRLSPVFAFIEENHRRPIGLDELAAIGWLTPEQTDVLQSTMSALRRQKLMSALVSEYSGEIADTGAAAAVFAEKMQAGR